MSCCDEAVVATIVEERAGVLGFARVKCAEIDALVERGRLSAELAAEVKASVRGFADSIATGLHRDGNDPIGVRAAMRRVVLG